MPPLHCFETRLQQTTWAHAVRSARRENNATGSARILASDHKLLPRIAFVTSPSDLRERSAPRARLEPGEGLPTQSGLVLPNNLFKSAFPLKSITEKTRKCDAR